MKLVQKLTIALILGISAVLAVNGSFRVRRELALFQSERIRDHRLVGLALGAAFAAVWRADGEAHARAMLEQASAREDKMRIRWIAPALAVPGLAGSGSVAPGDMVTRVVTDAGGEPVRRTYVPVAVDAATSGQLEISEPLAGERSYLRTSVVDTVLTTALLSLVSAALSAGLGAWFVGRPMRSLIDKARRVGRGDFSGPLRLRQRDEVAELAGEMNAMCDQLVEANAHRAAEAAARIAALEQLRHADRLMTVGKLASGIAHELGTPLNVIGARAGMIVEGETAPGEAAEYARVIVAACDQMTRIIRQLLDFARPRDPERAAEDVGRIVERAAALIEPIAAKKGVTLSTAARAGDAPPVAEVDAGQIQQVVTNLLVNAVQAMDAPGTVEVLLTTERAVPPPEHGGGEAPFVCVRVRDRGQGIAPENVPHVFEPFFTTKDVGDGTGLGLSVAYGIVREHHGWMVVESTVGQGSEFRVYLPAKEPG